MHRIPLIIVVGLAITTSASAGDDAARRTIAYVQKLQADNGGFRAYEPKPDATKIMPTLRSTSAAVRALKYLGGEIPKKEACIKFVESCWDDETGGFGDAPKGKPDVFTTAVGLMAVTELGMPTEKYSKGAVKYLSDNAKGFDDIRIAVAGLERLNAKAPKANAWLNEVVKLQNKDGTYGKDLGLARDTASSIVTVLRLGGKAPHSNPYLKVLNAGQRQNGGWGKADSEIASDLETTYRVMRCFMMLKAKPAYVEGVRSFVAKCRNPDGGYAVMPGQPSSVSGTYFAAITLHWLKDK